MLNLESEPFKPFFPYPIIPYPLEYKQPSILESERANSFLRDKYNEAKRSSNLIHMLRIHIKEISLVPQDMFFLSNEDILAYSNTVFYRLKGLKFDYEGEELEEKIVKLLLIQAVARCVYRELQKQEWSGNYLDKYIMNIEKYNNPKNKPIIEDKLLIGNSIIDTFGSGIEQLAKSFDDDEDYGKFELETISWSNIAFMEESVGIIPEIWGSWEWLDGKKYSKSELISLIKKIAGEISRYRLSKNENTDATS